jgi:hypothetical protein
MVAAVLADATLASTGVGVEEQDSYSKERGTDCDDKVGSHRVSFLAMTTATIVNTNQAPTPEIRTPKEKGRRLRN